MLKKVTLKKTAPSIKELLRLERKKSRDLQAALNQKERLLQTVVNSVPDFIFIKDRQSRVTFANSASAKAAGLKKGSDLQGKSDFEILNSKEARAFFDEEQKIMISGKPMALAEKSFVDQSGRKSIHLVTKVPVRDGKGRVTGLFGISRDITYLKELEEKLREINRELEGKVKERTAKLSRINKTLKDEIKLRKKLEKDQTEQHHLIVSLINLLPEFLYVKDLDSRVVLANKACAQAAGLRSPEEMIGKNDRDFADQESADAFRKVEQQVMKTGKPIYNFPEWNAEVNGKRKCILSTKFPLLDQNGKCIGLVGIGRDVTELKVAEEESTRKHELLRAVINQLPDYIYVKSTEGKVLLANTASARGAGLESADQMIGLSDFDTFTFEKANEFFTREKEIMTSGVGIQNVEEWTEQKDGQRRCVLSTKLALYDTEKKCIGLVGIGKDVTELKKQDALVMRTDRLAAVGTLASGAAHQFNNLHTIVIGCIEAILRDDTPCEKTRNRLDLIMETTLKATTITRSLLAFARKGKGQAESADLNEMLKQTVRLIFEDFRTKGIDVQLRLIPINQFVMEFDKLSHVVMNLLINASHAVHKKADQKIIVSSGVVGERAFFTVEDTGCGISESNMGFVFDPFFTTKGVNADGLDPQAEIKGTGLGLSVCSTIVQEHMGEMTVESELNKGTVFTVWLPMNRLVNDVHVPPLQELKVLDVPKRVLIIEDEQPIRELLADALKVKGFETFLACDGEDALKVLDQQNVDLIVTDIQMPRMNGIEFLRAFQSRTMVARPLCIVVTGQNNASVETFKELGVFQVIQKPFTVKKLYDSIACAFAC